MLAVSSSFDYSLIAVAGVALAASILFSTLSYALRIMSRVHLETALGNHQAGKVILGQILETRYQLALAVSTFRLAANTVILVCAILYFQHQSFLGPRVSAATMPQDVAVLTTPPPVDQLWVELFQAVLLALVVTLPVIMVFSIAIPQAWARYAGEKLIAAMYPLLRATAWALYPFVASMNLLDELVRRLAGVAPEGDPDEEAQQVQDEIMAVVSEGTAEGTVDEEQKKMIEGVISFRDLQVGQIMTPRTEIVALEITAGLADVQEKVMKDGLSRVPIFENTLDNVIGILYAKDLLNLLTPASESAVAGGPALAPAAHKEFDLRRIMHPPLFVPRTKPLRDLLKEMRAQQVHLAVVLDEYGGTSGLVTTEDIVEEIVGDIADEFERPAPAELKRIDARTLELDARMNIAEINRQLDLHLPDDQGYQTIGGFVINTLGSIPLKGEKLVHEGLVFTVLESEPRRIRKLRLVLPEKEGGVLGS